MTLPGLSVLVALSLALGGTMTPSPETRALAQATPELLSKSIVGTWVGEAVLPWSRLIRRTNFGGANLQVRFTEYTVIVDIGAYTTDCNAQDHSARWVGDYHALGNGVIISPHSNTPTILKLVSVVITGDTLEALTDRDVGCQLDSQTGFRYYLGEGVRLRRQ